MSGINAASFDRVLAALVAVAAIGLAVFMFTAYAADPDLLWRDFYHDRNSHFSFGLELALAMRTFDPVWFFSEIEKAKVWPPFHGLVLSAVLAVGGPHHRLAILPSLAGWAMTVVFVWLIVRRMFAARIAGIFAAAVAVILTAASPILRMISADVMLEGLGSGLSALALWAYLRANSEPGQPGHWRLLALTLTALFFHKGNYWGIVAAALAAAYVSEHARALFEHWRAFAKVTEFGALARWAWRDPLLVAGAVALTVSAYLYWRGPTSIVLFGNNVRLHPPENLVTLGYALLFLRAAIGWYRHRAAFEAWLGQRGIILWYWHAAPVLVSFLLPKRLTTFLWFVGPANAGGAARIDPLEGIRFYWQAFAEGFHLAPWMAVLAVVLAVLGATQIRRFPPGARAVFFLALLGFLAVVIHPQHQGRFLTSWVFAVWIAAGAGAGVLFNWALSKRAHYLQLVTAAAAILLLASANLWYQPSPAAYRHAFRSTSGPSDLDLVRPYLKDLDGVREVMIATTFGMSRLFRWTLHEDCQCKRIVEDPWIDNLRSRAEVRRVMAERIARSAAERIVIIDAPGGRYSYPVLGWTYEVMAGIVDAMESQDRYVRVATYPIPSQGAQAVVWRRRD